MSTIRFLPGVIAVVVLSACSLPPVIVLPGAEMPSVPEEEGRIAEARANTPTQATFYYDIGMSGFVSEGAIDLAVLREFCRPGRVGTVTETAVPFMGSITAEMYTPRLIEVTCVMP